MSEFLVKRLRDGCVGDKSAGWWRVSEHLTDSLCNEAASEIERLTAELKRVQELHTGLMKNADDRYDALTAELAAAKGLLARCGNHIRYWHAKYGEHQPQWLPPANGALFIQAIDAALTDKQEPLLHS